MTSFYFRVSFQSSRFKFPQIQPAKIFVYDQQAFFNARAYCVDPSLTQPQ